MTTGTLDYIRERSTKQVFGLLPTFAMCCHFALCAASVPVWAVLGMMGWRL